MKICVFGTGAVGGHLAALLADAGYEVSAVMRGAALDAVRRDGLAVHLDDRIVRAQIRASDKPEELGAQDILFVTVKSSALPQAALSMRPLIKPDTTVVFAMNGIPWWYYHAHGGPMDGRRIARLDPAGTLWDMIGPQLALGCTTSSACTVLAPGVVEVKGGNRQIAIGEPDGSLSSRLRLVSGMLEDAGFPVVVSQHIRDKIWSKLALNLASGPMAVLAPVSMKEMFAEPACIAARYRIHEEVAAIAAAMGCRTDVDIEGNMAIARTSSHTPSIAQDVLKGRKPELETMFLQPLEMARECQVETPMLDLLVALALLKVKSQRL
ncbi:MAG: ketopantoate reductase family protein [Noviherbaspirillum sp.]